MTFRELEKLLKKDGWRLKSVRGSHHHYTHPTKPGKITIPNHKGDLKIKTVDNILKQAGLK
ncbi:type II toxin-antitoxin system HicA family toxin [Dialister invisus]|jgi:predicted RNA binding protein YcfA (HicA-like mRNA interferase family)|uniref:type II toxin-antitoxin system HicA family toxin n=1 Tax=Dialister invisus TaxID=218538 RepID=UPI003FD6DC7F